jgi:hypothetical protein
MRTEERFDKRTADSSTLNDAVSAAAVIERRMRWQIIMNGSYVRT